MPDDQQPKPKRPRLTDAQKIASMEQRLAHLKTRQATRTRKAETREKIVIGGAIVKAMRDNPDWRARLIPLLQSNVTRAIDREAIASWLSAT